MSLPFRTLSPSEVLTLCAHCCVSAVCGTAQSLYCAVAMLSSSSSSSSSSFDGVFRHHWPQPTSEEMKFVWCHCLLAEQRMVFCCCLEFKFGVRRVVIVTLCVRTDTSANCSLIEVAYKVTRQGPCNFVSSLVLELLQPLYWSRRR